jgi:plastocyanin
MSTRNSRTWWPLVGAAALMLVLLAGCTGTPPGQAPATTPATPATTVPPAATMTTVATTTVAPTTTVTTIQTTVVTTVPATPSLPGSFNITITNFAFSPASVTVPAGSMVTWTNQDSVPHTIVNDFNPLFSQGAMFTSSQLQTGQSFSFTFKDPGTFGYHCGIHTYMKGTVTVT